MDARLVRIKELLAQKEAVDFELESLIAGAPLKTPKPRICDICGQQGHTARKCPHKAPAPSDKDDERPF